MSGFLGTLASVGSELSLALTLLFAGLATFGAIYAHQN